MKSLIGTTRIAAKIGAAIIACMPITAMAVDFDEEGVVVNGIKYGIIGTEAPYSAYVVRTDMFDDDFEYEGDITIPETIEFESGKTATVTGIDNQAFYSTSVTSVTLPNSVTTIGKQAFGLCSSLATVKMGSGVTEIMSKAFFPDAKLTTMFINAMLPPVIASDALMNAPEKMTLYVPAAALDNYKNAEIWNKIGNIVPQDDFVKVTEIVVSPSTAVIQEMGTVLLSATVYPAEAEQKVSWMSSDTNVARVSNTGEVFGVKNGVCTITAMASDGSGVKGECLVTVGSGKRLDLNLPYISGYKGESFILTATVAPENTTVEWSVEDTKIASVASDGLKATVTLLSAGRTNVLVKASNGLSEEIEVNVREKIALTGIEVDPSVIECEVGDMISIREFTVTPVPENASEFTPSFSIEDTNIVDYDPDDFDMESFMCIAPGKTRLIWSQNDIQGWCTVIVKGEEVMLNSIILDPDHISRVYNKGDHIQITATPEPADAVDFNPSWSSSNNAVATVDNSGLVTVVSPNDDVVITCLSGTIKAECKIHFESTGIAEINVNKAHYRIMSIDGMIIKEDATREELDSLIPGVYIVNGIKILK